MYAFVRHFAVIFGCVCREAVKGWGGEEEFNMQKRFGNLLDKSTHIDVYIEL